MPLGRTSPRNIYAINQSPRSTTEYERPEFNLPTAKLLDIITNLRNKHDSLTKKHEILKKDYELLEKRYESLDKDTTRMYRAYQDLYNMVSQHIDNPRDPSPVFNNLQSPTPLRKPDNYQEDSSETRGNMADFLQGIESNPSLYGGRNTRRKNTRSKTRRNTRSKTRRKNRSKRNTRSKRRNTKRRRV